MEIDKELYIKTYGKKKYQELCRKNRIMTADMNLGTRVMKTEKDYSRKRKHKRSWEEE